MARLAGPRAELGVVRSVQQLTRPTTPTRVRAGIENERESKTGVVAASYLSRTPRNSIVPSAGQLGFARRVPLSPAGTGAYASDSRPVVYSSTRSTSFIEISRTVFRLTTHSEGQARGQWRVSGGPVEGQWRASGGAVEVQWRGSGGSVESRPADHKEPCTAAQGLQCFLLMRTRAANLAALISTWRCGTNNHHCRG